MLLLTDERAPLVESGALLDGMIQQADGTSKPGDILQLWLELRRKVGTVKAKKKEGVKFKVRSADEVVDRIRPAANELGILIYPGPSNQFGTSRSTGKGHVVEDGTLAEQELLVIVQAVSDGSRLALWGFGLGADNQDKAGGKAGTYAFKQALVQALLAGGAEDTDDTDTPIEGGVRKKTRAAAPTVETAGAALDAATTEEQRKEALKLVVQLSPDRQLQLKDKLIAAKARVQPATT